MERVSMSHGNHHFGYESYFAPKDSISENAKPERKLIIWVKISKQNMFVCFLKFLYQGSHNLAHHGANKNGKTHTHIFLCMNPSWQCTLLIRNNNRKGG